MRYRLTAAEEELGEFSQFQGTDQAQGTPMRNGALPADHELLPASRHNPCNWLKTI